MFGSARLTRVVAIELTVLVALTISFLILVPERPAAMDAGLALAALALLAANARYTRRVIWAQFPVDGGRRQRTKKTLTLVVPATGAVVMALAVAGLILGYADGGWRQAIHRVAEPYLFATIPIYFLWALLQQTLFQIYVLGRLRTLLPAWAAIACTGSGYALVHLPDFWITGATVLTGIFWTFAYDRHRILWPLALSHGILGATFYSWIYERNLAVEWARLW